MTIEDFKPMIKMAVEDTVKSRTMIAYCDYIAYQIQKNLKALDAVHDSFWPVLAT